MESIASKLGAQVVTTRHSIVLTILPEKLRDACKLIEDEMPEFYHMTTITGLDEGNTIGLFYHFWKGREFLSIKTSIPKTNPDIDSLNEILPASLLYEAEVKDLVGVNFKGNPLMNRKLVLPDNYPAEAPPPLRKEADPEKIRKLMELE